MMSIQTGKRGKKAIVIGASMAGLLAARVLADHFEQVTLLERDTFPGPGANRKGVPQGRHVHVLLELGRQIMEMYLPGLTDELTRLGAANMADVSLQVRWFHSGDYHQPGPSGIAGLGVARPTLEAAVRARVLALPNVQVVEDCHGSWNAAVGNDLGFAEVEGPRTPMVRFLNWYLGKVHVAAHHEDEDPPGAPGPF